MKGKVFTQDQQGQLFQIEGNKLENTYPQTQTNQIIAGIVPHENGLLIIYNSGDIEFSTPFGAKSEFTDLAKALRGTFVNHVLQLSDTRLAISTQRAGLFLYNLQERSLEKVTTKEGLESNACLRSFQDYSGNLWIGMQNGIALIHVNSPLRLLSKEININGSGYEAYETPEGTYFTTSNGIYFLEKGAAQSIFLQGTEGPAYSIQKIAGKYYAGHHTGLFLLENRQATRIAEINGLWNIKQLRYHPGYVLGGTYSGLFLFKIDTENTLEAVQPIEGFKASSRFFEEDRLGNIWVSQYYQGLYQLKLSDDLAAIEVKNVSEESDLPIKEQIILSRINDELYLATNLGIYQIHPESETVIESKTFSEQIGEQPVYLLVQDGKNRVHVVAENFIAHFDQISPNNYQFTRSSLYQMRYHLNNDLLFASIHTSNGVLFSANDGFIYYDPALENNFANTPSLLISKIREVSKNTAIFNRTAFAEKKEISSPISLGSNIKVLKLEVESFQFNGLENQQFRYYLKGQDKDFSEWTNTASKEYTNLPEGKYTFMVQGRNHLGEIISGQPLSFTVRAPFYRSTFAKITYVLLGILALFLGAYLQRRRYKIKAVKTAEVKQQKLMAIERKKEQELLQLKEEKMKSEIQHVNKLLAASTMNLVVKNEFIESIKEEITDVKSLGVHKDARKALEKIVKEINVNLRVQEDWQQFEYHFDAVHGDFLARLRHQFPDISPNEQKLCAFLRLNLNTKDISNLLGISVRGVEVARYRLRKKLDLLTGQNLSKFILDY